MKTRIRELARTGIYGSEDNPQVVNADDLRQIAETFPEITKAPIQLGHWGDPARPRLGNVIGVSWNEKTQTLIGTLEEQDALAQAVDDGYYPDVSIGSKRRAEDGKMYLHHLAYLGEEPPAIKDLVDQITQSLDPSAPDTIAASDSDGVTLIPPLASRLTLADPAKTPQQHPKKEKPMTLEEAMAALDAEKAKTLALSDQVTAKDKTLTALATKYPEEQLLLSDGRDPQVSVLTTQLRKNKTDGLVAAASGKVPKAKLPLLAALAESLPLNASIELADSDGKKTQVNGFDLVGQILESIPSPVKPGSLDLSDPADEGQKISSRDMLKNF